MSIYKQKTVSNIITIEGIGLHSGKMASLKIKPASINSGIIFKRVDLKKHSSYNRCRKIRLLKCS